MSKNFKYTSEFEFCLLKAVVSEDRDKYLALASAAEIKSFVPDVNSGQNIDLLPIAFNAAVVNRVNRNGDVIDTNTAIASYKNFINKPINIEHNRERIVGVILTAGFSKFGSDEVLSEEDAKQLKGPFNITLGGVIWKVANQNLADSIEESSDPTSSKYQKISASWELGFNDFNLVAIEGESKNIEDGVEVANDSDSFEYLKSNLKAFGGSGKIGSKLIYRKVMGNVVPLGIGLTENPAADVKGIVISDPNDKKDENENEDDSENDNEDDNEKDSENDTEDSCEAQKSEESFSKIQSLNVNTDIHKNVMKLTSVKDITDESLKQATASQISDLIEQELKDASEKFAAEKNKVQGELDSTLQNLKDLKATQDTLQAELAELKQKLELAEQEKAKIIASEKFNERMSAFDAEYDLDAETRQVLASDIAGLDDEGFAAYKNKMALFLKNKKKGEMKNGGKEEAKETKASVAQVVEEVTENASEDKANVALPNTSTASTSSMYDKYKSAFDYDSFVVSK